MERWTRGLVWLAWLWVALGAWAGWGYVVVNLTPEDMANRLAFLGLLFLALASTLTFPAYLVAGRLHRRWPLVRDGFAVAVRQGMLGALFVVICAALQMSHSLTGGHVVLILSMLVIIEVFLQVRRETPTR